MLRAGALARYGILGLPLAFAGLPIYVNVPKFYAETLSLDLGTLGALLLVLRLFDAISDPVIGWASDRLPSYERRIMIAGVPVLIVGYGALFNPPPWGFSHPAAWLGGCLFLVYLSFSALTINYYARGVDLADTPGDNTRIAAYREGFMLIGVLFASLLPTILLRAFDMRVAYGIFGMCLAPLLIVCALCTLSAPVVRRPQAGQGASSFFTLLRFADIRWILAVGFSNAIPTAITSTLFLFFTRDVLHAESYSGPLLALYFLSAAGGMPIWTRLSLLYGKKRSLMIAMLVVILCFVWTVRLGAGDVLSFAAICFLSGVTLGADSMLLPALLGDALKDKPWATATGFGLWNFTGKLTMAVAAGLALPLLAHFGYLPGQGNSHSALFALSFCYAVMPCAIKIIALIVLYCSPLDRKESEL